MIDALRATLTLEDVITEFPDLNSKQLKYVMEKAYRHLVQIENPLWDLIEEAILGLPPELETEPAPEPPVWPHSESLDDLALAQAKGEAKRAASNTGQATYSKLIEPAPLGFLSPSGKTWCAACANAKGLVTWHINPHFDLITTANVAMEDRCHFCGKRLDEKDS